MLSGFTERFANSCVWEEGVLAQSSPSAIDALLSACYMCQVIPAIAQIYHQVRVVQPEHWNGGRKRAIGEIRAGEEWSKVFVLDVSLISSHLILHKRELAEYATPKYAC